MKVLVCDDSILARSQMKDILDGIGDFEIIEAKSGDEAIDLFKEHKPGIAFLDIVMPGKNGIDAVNEIVEYDSEAKIVMASSIGNNKYLMAALEAGAVEFIQKPVDAIRVKEVLEKVLGGGF